MTGNEFKTARKTRLKYSQADLAIAMQTPKRTLQDIEAQGDQQIRGIYAACIELLIWKDQVTMQGIIEAVDRDLARRYPAGIPATAERP
jgi:DNA-binding transcriptional regulator YiaG